jgi:outer membrane translocation and assembly module TamA
MLQESAVGLVLGAAWAQAPGDAQQQPQAQPSFELEVRSSNRDVRELLQRHLDLQRYREVPDLDDAELQRLLRLADRNARELLGTLGYFTPSLEIRREPGAEGTTPRVVVAAEPGPATTVDGVDVAFEGDIRTTDAPDAAAAFASGAEDRRNSIRTSSELSKYPSRSSRNASRRTWSRDCVGVYMKVRPALRRVSLPLRTRRSRTVMIVV